MQLGNDGHIRPHFVASCAYIQVTAENCEDVEKAEKHEHPN